MQKLTPEILLSAYSNGYFPMSDSRNSKGIFWYNPDLRGIIPLDKFHIPKSLEKFMRSSDYEIKMNSAFEQVIKECADKKTSNREDTWINDEIISVYSNLAKNGNAMSFETWQNGELIGGLYGVAIGKAFFGESMFSHKENASKIALVHLVKFLNENKYKLLDTQYVNNHLTQFGVIEIKKEDYLVLLKEAIKQ